MSSDQVSLSSFDEPRHASEESEAPTPAWEPQRADTCLGCGGHVTEQYRKVCGDNDDRVHACPSCSNKHGSERKAAGLHSIGGGER